jgi:hypothetical protein
MSTGRRSSQGVPDAGSAPVKVPISQVDSMGRRNTRPKSPYKNLNSQDSFALERCETHPVEVEDDIERPHSAEKNDHQECRLGPVSVLQFIPDLLMQDPRCYPSPIHFYFLLRSSFL